MRSNKELSTSSTLRKSNLSSTRFKTKNCSTIKLSRIMLTFSALSNLKRERSKRRLSQLELKMPNLEIKSETYNKTPKTRSKRPRRNMKEMPRSINQSSESRPRCRKRTLQSSRTSTKKCKKFTRRRWVICKRDLPRKQRRWRLQKEDARWSLKVTVLTCNP